MAKTRVLVVDDSAVTRRLVSEALATDPSLEVAGTASNGRLALARLAQINPDVVTLDVEMPELDGLGTLVELRKTHPDLPVIMFSAITERGASATLDAIAKGASDYVTKPSASEGFEDAKRRIAAELVPRIRAFAKIEAPPPAPPPPAAPVIPAPTMAHAPLVTPSSSRPTPVAPPRASAGRQKIELVCIGVSTGGPNALAQVIPKLPKGFPVPVLLVQHMPPVFTKLLAERLASQSQLAVVECQGNEQLKPGTVYIAKGDFHMVLKGSRADPRLANTQGPPENSCRPAVDTLFRSVAEIYGANTLAVILTGMGQDGLRGCEKIREAGGVIFAQDQATSVIWGMPGAIARAGIADKILPLARVAPEMVTQVAAGRGEPLRRTFP